LNVPAGEYYVSVTVQDEAGANTTAVVHFTVVEPFSPIPLLLLVMYTGQSAPIPAVYVGVIAALGLVAAAVFLFYYFRELKA